MATQALTTRGIDALPAPRTRIEIFDLLTPGLAIRVTPTGHKSWTLLYRHQGRHRRLTLGRYPDLGLAEARRKAIRERGRIVDGADPATEKQDDRATFGDTIDALFTAYEVRYEKRKSWHEVKRILKHDVLPFWGHRRVQDITRRDVRELVENKARAAPVMANRVLARVSAFLTFALERDWIDANPAFRIRKPTDETSRDRVLTREELRAVWAALHETEARDDHGLPLPRLSAPLNDAFVVLLLTAQRCGEVCRMKWRDVDLETGWWTIPGQDAKNHDAHRVPLTALAREILHRRHQRDDDKYVFSSNGHAAVADRAKKAAAHLCRGLPFQFRAHDFRRTAASYMAEAGVDRMHIAHVLNHRSVTRSSVTAIYDRYNYDKEKRAALEKWAQVLASSVSPKSKDTKAPTQRAPVASAYELTAQSAVSPQPTAT